jgi:hypothetical protein
VSHSFKPTLFIALLAMTAALLWAQEKQQSPTQPIPIQGVRRDAVIVGGTAVTAQSDVMTIENPQMRFERECGKYYHAAERAEQAANSIDEASLKYAPLVQAYTQLYMACRERVK